MTCRRLWNDFAADSPGCARIVTAWVQKDNAQKAEATARVDAVLEKADFVTKAMGSGICLKCLSRLKAKWPKCPSCGAKSKLYNPKAGRMKKLKAQPRKARRRVAKAAQVAMLTKASGSRWPVYNEHQAVTAMLLADCNSPDPDRREAAKIALANHR